MNIDCTMLKGFTKTMSVYMYPRLLCVLLMMCYSFQGPLFKRGPKSTDRILTKEDDGCRCDVEIRIGKN